MDSRNKIATFHWADYLVFGASLLFSLLIGVYFAIQDKIKKRDTTFDFLLAGRNAQMIPVAMSMLASFISAIYVIGFPAEMILTGTMYMWTIVGSWLGAVVAAQVFVPVFHNMGVTSVYEYLEERFNGTVRILGSLTFILMMVFYMAVVLYAPALAFTTVTGVSMWITIFGIGIICTLYTALGGMKAVLWTDTFQMVIIFGGLIALVIKGTIDAGGISKVFDISSKGGRIEFDNISVDPRERHTVWGVVIGNAFMILGFAAGNQIVIQRYLSIRKVVVAQISIYVAIAGGTVVAILLGLLGLVIYAYYDCDLMVSGLAPEEVVPTFMMHVLGHLHGLPGLFTASVFAASLSTVSSAVQALAAVFLEDIIRPIHRHFKREDLSDKKATILARILALLFGLLTIGLSYLSPLLGPFLLQIANSIFGTLGGPLFGLFTLAIFFPCANSWGAAIGLITSLVFTLWINIGAIVIGVVPILLPLRMENCSYDNATEPVQISFANATNSDPSTQEPAINELYKVSYMWYTVIPVIVVVVVGLLISAVTGFRKDLPPLRTQLVFPYLSFCGGCCNANLCGVEDEATDKILTGDIHKTKDFLVGDENAAYIVTKM